MAYVISNECIACGTCETECPVGCIEMGDEGIYVIAESECIDCGTCLSVCPVEAPQPR